MESKVKFSRQISDNHNWDVRFEVHSQKSQESVIAHTILTPLSRITHLIQTSNFLVDQRSTGKARSTRLSISSTLSSVRQCEITWGMKRRCLCFRQSESERRESGRIEESPTQSVNHSVFHCTVLVGGPEAFHSVSSFSMVLCQMIRHLHDPSLVRWS